MTAKRLLVVAGPTAVGKSNFALGLAQGLDGEVVSLDSVAVYRGLDIGAAKPSQQTRKLIKHHLIDVIDPSEQINAAHFIELAHAAITDIQARGKVAVVVGGSTMYLTALLYGLAALEPARAEMRVELSFISTPELYSELTQRDPARAAALHPHDRIRIERAVESVRQAKQIPSKRIAEHGNRDLRYAAMCFCLCLERPKLYARIDARVSAMLTEGLVAEALQIIEKYGAHCPGLKAIGYAEVVQMLSQQIGASELAAKISQNTRRFAKRQLTYWRNEPLKRNWSVEPAQTWPSDGGGKVVFPDFVTIAGELEQAVSRAEGFLRRSDFGVEVKYVKRA